MNLWQRMWRRKQLEDRLDKELRFHLEQHTRDLIEEGLDPAEARRQALLALGGSDQVKESCREARGTLWLEDIIKDTRYALRNLKQHLGFTTVVLLTLALGTGATTVMFTVINGVLLKSLPYPEPGRLAAIHGHTGTWNTKAFGEQNLAYLDFLDARRESRSLAITGWIYDGGTVSEPGDPEYTELREASFDLFSVLGLTPARGRFFLAEEDRAGATPVAILGYSFWRRHFAGRPEVLGESLVLDGKHYTIVGVAPADFRLGGSEADVYTPLGQNAAPYMQSRRPHPVTVIARLNPDATFTAAQEELTAIGRHLAEQFPDSNGDRSFVVAPLRPNVGGVGSTLWLLLGAVSLVLAIACVNVASLLLARAVTRERELALRSALGARWNRLVRQCLTESVVLSLSGGLLGILFAYIGIRPFVAFWPGSLPRAEEVHLDWRVLLFAAAVSLMSGLLFGMAPALRAPTRNLDNTLRAGGRIVTGTSRRLHSLFVVSEIALAAVLLVSAGMLGRTLLRLTSLDSGVDVRNVLITRMALSPSVFSDAGRARAAWQDVLARARRVPGVRFIATVDTVPMRNGNNQLGYWTTADVPPENKQPLALATCVTSDYLKVMGIALRSGRFFDDRDRAENKSVIVIDEVLAHNAFGGQNPIGKLLWVPGMAPDAMEIIGVVGHVRHWGLAGDDQAEVRAQFYYPFSQLPDRFVSRWSQLMSIAVRSQVEPLSIVESLRKELKGDSADQVLYQVRTLDQLASNSLSQQRFLLLLFGVFAFLALLLACVGIYGVLAYLTTERIPEIGIRMALGDSPGHVMRQVLWESLGMILIGAIAGLLGALAAARVMIHLVDGMAAADPETITIMVSVLVAAALWASFIPARRASRVDPMRALRLE
jgi:predicted permease